MEDKTFVKTIKFLELFGMLVFAIGELLFLCNGLKDSGLTDKMKEKIKNLKKPKENKSKYATIELDV